MLPPASPVPPLKTCFYIFIYVCMPLAVVGLFHLGFAGFNPLSFPPELRGRRGGLFIFYVLFLIWAPILLVKFLPRALPALHGLPLFVGVTLMTCVGAVFFKAMLVGVMVLLGAFVNTMLIQ